MKNQRLIQANERLLQRQLLRGFIPEWYIVYHFNDGFNSRHQQKRRVNPDEVSRDVAFHKHVLYQFAYCNRRWAKIPNRARSVWSIEYGRSSVHPHINILIESLPMPLQDLSGLNHFFNTTLPLRAKSVLPNSANIQPVINGSELEVLAYVCKETNENNDSIDYYSTDWIL